MKNVNDKGIYLATDADFEGHENDKFRYIGDSEIVEIPHVIEGVEVTSYENMFSYSYVKRVISTNLNINNMREMFSNSYSKYLDLDLETSNVVDMSGMFKGSDAVYINIDSFKTSKVEDMSEMFCDSKAKHLDFREFDFDTSNVTNMKAMYKNSKIQYLDLSCFDTSNVENMKSMFERSRLKPINLSRFKTSKVTDMSYMFSDSKATTLNLSNFTFNDGCDVEGICEGLDANVIVKDEKDTEYLKERQYPHEIKTIIIK